MDQALAALGGAVIGSLTGIGSGLLLENYKRHRDQCGVASSLSGEIASIMAMAKKRNHVANFTHLAQRAEHGEDVTVGPIVQQPHEPPHVFAKNIDRLGLLSGDLPSRIATFYTFVMGVRIDVGRLASREFAGKPKSAAIIIRQNLSLWREVEVLGNALVTDLNAVALARWRPWA